MTSSQAGLLVQVLEAAHDDWVDEGLIYSICLGAAMNRAEDCRVVDAATVRATAVDVAGVALVDGLLVAGDLHTDGFRSWDVRGAAAARVVAGRWLAADGPVVEVGSVAWFDITDAGERFLRREMEGAPGVTRRGHADVTGQGAARLILHAATSPSSPRPRAVDDPFRERHQEVPEPEPSGPGRDRPQRRPR